MIHGEEDGMGKRAQETETHDKGALGPFLTRSTPTNQYDAFLHY